MVEEPNVFVSNGTCYSGPNHAAADLLPCGNDYYGHVGCCQYKDNCLLGSACFNNEYGVTYVAGCTDPTYNDSTCPYKGILSGKSASPFRGSRRRVFLSPIPVDTERLTFSDAPWLGMSYCNGTSNQWVLCDQPKHPATLTYPANCFCPTPTTQRIVTFNASAPINLTGILPRSTGQSIYFQIGYYPTAPVTADPSPTNSEPTTGTYSKTTTSTLPFTTMTIPADSDVVNVGLSAPAKAGLVAGASIIGLIVVAGMAFALLRRRRIRKKWAKEEPLRNSSNENTSSPQQHNVPIGAAYGGGAGDPVSPLPARSLAPESDIVSPISNKADRPWSVVSELDGTGVSRGPTPGRLDSVFEGRVCGGLAEAGLSELPAQCHTELSS